MHYFQNGGCTVNWRVIIILQSPHMYPTSKTDDALHDFPTDTKFYFLYNIQLVNIQNLYEVAVNTVNSHYTLPH